MNSIESEMHLLTNAVNRICAHDSSNSIQKQNPTERIQNFSFEGFCFSGQSSLGMQNRLALLPLKTSTVISSALRPIGLF